MLQSKGNEKMRKTTKLVVTFRPSMTADDLISMIRQGVSAFRLNCAHLNRRQIHETTELFRWGANIVGVKIKLFADLPGAKARVWFSPKKRLVVNPGDRLLFRQVHEPRDDGTLQIIGSELLERVDEGSHLVIHRRGKIQLHVEKLAGDYIEAIALSGGLIGWGYHITCQGPYLSIAGLSVQDKWILPTVLEAKPDFICPSFADSPVLIHELREYMESVGANTRILAKIEDILAVADGAIVGRDDLSTWLDTESIRLETLKIIHKCKQRNLISVPASNYFSGLCENETLTSKNERDLAETLAAEPDFLYCNETHKVDCWEKVVSVARDLGMVSAVG
jgi:pyruvate kinase